MISQTEIQMKENEMTRDHKISPNKRNKQGLIKVVLLTGIFFAIEVAGSFWTGSLALFADAGHMLTDVAGIILALFAMHIAEKPPSPKRTYGYYRAEILAALINSMVLLSISVYILYESVERFLNPPEIQSFEMILVATLGLFVNAIGIILLRDGSRESLNVKGAYFEVMADFISSVGVIIAGAVMYFTDWFFIDSVVSAGIGLFIVPRTWNLMKESVGILLEGTPAGFDIDKLRSTILTTSGVESIHDLHVWSLTSGVNAASFHVVRIPSVPLNTLLGDINDAIRDNFGIIHTTIQLEDPGFEEHEIHL